MLVGFPLSNSERIKPLGELDQIQHWKEEDYKVVFTNGVFDILHVGHVDYLEKARALGDRLVVGLNSDISVHTLEKGDDRPINPQGARAKVLAALRCVDAVVIFDDTTPRKLILDVMPDVLAKGGDYDPEVRDESDKRYIVGSDEVIKNGGVVQTIPLVEGFSTTKILNKARS